MERKRCQVCAGPIVNNRCKLCGMPYRNDETLYHLNENRSEHYRHATSKARAIMRQEEVPLGDKKPGTAASQGSSATKKTTYSQKSTTAKSSYTQKSGQFGGSSPKKTSQTGSSYGQKKSQTGSSYAQKTGQTSGTYAQSGTYSQKRVSQGNTYAGSSYRTKTSGSVKEKKKHPLLVWMIVLCVLSAGIPEIRNILQEVGFEIGEVQQYEMQSADVFQAGDEIPAGHYTASCEDGEIQFMIVGDNQESGIMRVDEDNEQKITLSEGDLIGIISASPSDAVLVLTSH